MHHALLLLPDKNLSEMCLQKVDSKPVNKLWQRCYFEATSLSQTTKYKLLNYNNYRQLLIEVQSITSL